MHIVMRTRDAAFPIVCVATPKKPSLRTPYPLAIEDPAMLSPSKKIIAPRLAMLEVDVLEGPSLLTKIRVLFPLTRDPDRIYRPILVAEEEPFPITNRVPRVHRFTAYYSCWCVCHFTTRWTLSSDPSKTSTTLVQVLKLTSRFSG